MPVKAVTRSALVETITNPRLDQRVRKNAAKNLIENYPSLTKNLQTMLELMPRPVSAATFDACADAIYETKEKR